MRNSKIGVSEGTVLLWVMLLFGACKEDVNLAKVSSEVQFDMGIGLPIGTLSATIGDFLGGEDIRKYIEVRNGQLYVVYAGVLEELYADLSVKEYSVEVEKKFYMPATSASEIEAGVHLDLAYPLILSIRELNRGANERVDSVHITKAHFASTIWVENMGIKAEDVDSIIVVFDEDNFVFDGGKRLNRQKVAINGFGEKMNVSIPNCMLMPQEDPLTGLYSDVEFMIHIHITTKGRRPVSNQAFFGYKFGLDFLDFDILYGHVSPLGTFSGTRRDTVDKFLPADRFPYLKLPLANPSMRFEVSTKSIGIPSVIQIADFYISHLDAVGAEQKVFITQNGNSTFSKALPYVAFVKDTATVVTQSYLLAADPHNGNLAALFKHTPAFYGFTYSAHLDKDAIDDIVAQGRSPFILNRPSIELSYHIEAPLLFDPSVQIAYSDTLKGVKFSSYAIDSLVTSVAGLDSIHLVDVAIAITAENKIPFNINCKFRFLDDNYDEILLAPLEENTMKIAGAANIQNGMAVEATRSNLFLRLNQDDLDKLSKVKNISYTAYMGDNTQQVGLFDDTQLKFTIGVTAKVKADFNFNKAGD